MAELGQTAGTPIVMPKLGLTMAEGLIVEWLVKPGDEIAAGQVLFVVETDKISNEIEASGGGRIISLLAAAGDTVPVGRPVALWTGAASLEASASAGATEIARPREAAERVRATPLARRMAKLGGLEIGEIAGTGPRGRIQSGDVQAVLDQRAALSSETELPFSGALVEVPASPERTDKRDLRPLIASRVSRSQAEIPHFYVSADASIDALAALRATLNADPTSPCRLSVTAMLCMAAARALEKRPHDNAVWREGRATPIDRLAIGVAVDTPGGVVAPVIPVGGHLHDFATALEAAVDRARGGRMTMADAGPAAFSLSNVGMFGVRTLTPIIDPDQSFMLGVGAPWVAFRPDEHGEPKAARLLTLTLACDHRLIDGAPAARLLSEIVGAIENPLRLLFHQRRTG